MIKFAFTAAVAASLSALVAVPAAAETVSVAYSDLDLSTPAGQDVLSQRVTIGAKSACERPDIRNLKAMISYEGCKDAALTDATAQLNAAGVTVAQN